MFVFQILVCFTLSASSNMGHMSFTVLEFYQQMMPLRETFWCSLTNLLGKWIYMLHGIMITARLFSKPAPWGTAGYSGFLLGNLYRCV